MHRLPLYLVSLQIGQPNNPGRAFAMLACRQDALGDETANGCCAQRESGRCFVECYPTPVSALSLAVDVAVTRRFSRSLRIEAIVWSGI